jgi:hypothetical protein
VKSVRKGREIEEEVIQRDGSDGWTDVCRGAGRMVSLGSIPRRWAEPSIHCAALAGSLLAKRNNPILYMDPRNN